VYSRSFFQFVDHKKMFLCYLIFIGTIYCFVTCDKYPKMTRRLKNWQSLAMSFVVARRCSSIYARLLKTGSLNSQTLSFFECMFSFSSAAPSFRFLFFSESFPSQQNFKKVLKLFSSEIRSLKTLAYQSRGHGLDSRSMHLFAKHISKMLGQQCLAL
jgi:hypothetical protein